MEPQLLIFSSRASQMYCGGGSGAKGNDPSFVSVCEDGSYATLSCNGGINNSTSFPYGCTPGSRDSYEFRGCDYGYDDTPDTVCSSGGTARSNCNSGSHVS